MPPKKRKRPAADSEMASESESKRRASHPGSWLRSGTQRDDSVHGDVSLGEYAKLLNAAAPPSQSTRYRSPSKSKRANSLNTQTALTAEVTSSSAAAAAVSNAAVSPVEDIALSAKGTKAPRALGSVSSISTTPSGGSTTFKAVGIESFRSERNAGDSSWGVPPRSASAGPRVYGRSPLSLFSDTAKRPLATPAVKTTHGTGASSSSSLSSRSSSYISGPVQQQSLSVDQSVSTLRAAAASAQLQQQQRSPMRVASPLARVAAAAATADYPTAPHAQRMASMGSRRSSESSPIRATGSEDTRRTTGGSGSARGPSSAAAGNSARLSSEIRTLTIQAEQDTNFGTRSWTKSAKSSPAPSTARSSASVALPSSRSTSTSGTAVGTTPTLRSSSTAPIDEKMRTAMHFLAEIPPSSSSSSPGVGGSSKLLLSTLRVRSTSKHPVLLPHTDQPSRSAAAAQEEEEGEFELEEVTEVVEEIGISSEDEGTVVEISSATSGEHKGYPAAMMFRMSSIARGDSVIITECGFQCRVVFTHYYSFSRRCA